AERKDVLCTFFWMLTMWAYAGHVTSDDWRVTGSERRFTSLVTRHSSTFYWLALLCFALALMSKPMAVTLPFVLLLLDYWPLRRFTFHDLRSGVFLPLLAEKLPFIALAGASSIVTLIVQKHGGALLASEWLGFSGGPVT